MKDHAQNPIFEDKLVTIEQADFCSVPGYLILRLKTGASSLGDLKPDDAIRLGELLSSSVSAIENIVEADRVYCLSFCELDRHLHFHLFPRSPTLLRDYHKATNTSDEPINGPMLFEWAREFYPAGTQMPKEYPTLENVCAQLRSLIV